MVGKCSAKCTDHDALKFWKKKFGEVRRRADVAARLTEKLCSNDYGFSRGAVNFIERIERYFDMALSFDCSALDRDSSDCEYSA